MTSVVWMNRYEEQSTDLDTTPNRQYMHVRYARTHLILYYPLDTYSLDLALELGLFLSATRFIDVLGSLLSILETLGADYEIKSKNTCYNIRLEPIMRYPQTRSDKEKKE